MLSRPKDVLYLHALVTRPNDQYLARSMQYRTQMALARQSFQHSLFVDPTGMQGNFILGSHPGGIPYIPFEELTSHLLILGGTGAGKTNNFNFWLLQALFLARGIWIFDFFKREYRHLMPLAAKINREMYVLRWRQLPYNPLEVPDAVFPLEWANNIADLFTSTLGVPPVARNILRVEINALYKQYGIYDGSTRYPTLRELAGRIRGIKANDAAKQAILNRLDTLLDTAGEMLDFRKGLPLKALENMICVFELDGLGLAYQCFITACWLAAPFSRRVASGNEQKHLLISLDEGQRIFSKSLASSSEGPSFISLMTSLVRAENIMLQVGVQTVDDLSRTIISNSATKILGRCGDQEDFHRMGRSMGLTAEQIEWCKFNLKPGLFVAKLNYGNNLHPFLLETPYVQI